jgi:hypothetical protein
LYEEAKDQNERRYGYLRYPMVDWYEWNVLYYSNERSLLSIETGIGDERKKKKTYSSIQMGLATDISNVMQAVLSTNSVVPRRRLAIAGVTVCPGLFRRTKLITAPRYQIVNLLRKESVMQDSCLDARNGHPLKSAVPFHWERSHLRPKFDWGSSIEKDGHL